MNRIRPIVGALLATLMLVPTLGFVSTPVFADEVALLPPGGGLTPPREEEPRPEEETGLAPPDTGSGDSESSSSSDYSSSEPTLQTRHFGLQVELSCAVAGASNAIVVVNHSAEDLPPGTRIKWQLKSEGKRGFFALLGPLAGGETLVADNVLEGSTNNGADCVARVI